MKRIFLSALSFAVFFNSFIFAQDESTSTAKQNRKIANTTNSSEELNRVLVEDVVSILMDSPILPEVKDKFPDWQANLEITLELPSDPHPLIKQGLINKDEDLLIREFGIVTNLRAGALRALELTKVLDNRDSLTSQSAERILTITKKYFDQKKLYDNAIVNLMTKNNAVKEAESNSSSDEISNAIQELNALEESMKQVISESEPAAEFDPHDVDARIRKLKELKYDGDYSAPKGDKANSGTFEQTPADESSSSNDLRGSANRSYSPLWIVIGLLTLTTFYFAVKNRSNT